MSGRIRSIKPEILEDEEICSLSDAAWRCWVSMWALADDHGNLRAGERYIAAQVWQDTSRQVADVFRELETKHRIVFYTNGGQPFAHIRNWMKHQRVDNAGKPKVPRLEDNGSTRIQLVRDEFAETRGDSPKSAESLESSPLARAPVSSGWKGGEGNGIGREAEGTASVAARSSAAAPVTEDPSPTDVIFGVLTTERPLYPVATRPMAEALAGRFATHQLAKGTKLEWVCDAIRECSTDHAGLGLTAEALAKKLRSYCDHARAPRSSEARPIAGTTPSKEWLEEEIELPSTEDAAKRGSEALAAIGGKARR